MRLLALTRYCSLGSSSRVRFYQYIPSLKLHGIDIQIAPFLSDDYVSRLYGGRHQSFISLVMAYLDRVAGLMKSRSFDLLWIEKELFPWLPAGMDNLFVGRHIPCVLDYDDAVFHRYDLHTNPLIRALLGKKIDAVMRQASTVVVGNEYLANHALQAGAKKIETLPSVVDINRYAIRKKSGDTFRVGWIGSPVTAYYLESIRNALQEFSRRSGVHLVLIGSGIRDPLPGVEKEVLPWSEESEVTNIQTFDVGIMPLLDGPFENGKCGYKLIQYMACGLPVIASPVGVNTRIVDQGITGLLASSNEEWLQALVLLSQNAAMRSEFGKAGRRKVEHEYSLQVTAPRLFEILSGATLS